MTGSSQTHMLHLNAIFSLEFSIKLKIPPPVIAVLLSKEQGDTRQNIPPIKACSEYKLNTNCGIILLHLEDVFLLGPGKTCPASCSCLVQKETVWPSLEVLAPTKGCLAEMGHSELQRSQQPHNLDVKSAHRFLPTKQTLLSCHSIWPTHFILELLMQDHKAEMYSSQTSLPRPLV